MDYTDDHPLRNKMICRLLGKSQVIPVDDFTATKQQIDILKCYDYKTIIKPLVIIDSYEGKLSVRQLGNKYIVHFMFIQRIISGVTQSVTHID